MTIDLRRDDLIVEDGLGGGRYGIVLQAGPVAFDVLWLDGGSTTRFRHSWGRHIHTITEEELRRERGRTGYDPVKIIRHEAAKVRRERRHGAGIRRGGGL